MSDLLNDLIKGMRATDMDMNVDARSKEFRDRIAGNMPQEPVNPYRDAFVPGVPNMPGAGGAGGGTGTPGTPDKEPSLLEAMENYAAADIAAAELRKEMNQGGITNDEYYSIFRGKGSEGAAENVGFDYTDSEKFGVTFKNQEYLNENLADNQGTLNQLGRGINRTFWNTIYELGSGVGSIADLGDYNLAANPFADNDNELGNSWVKYFDEKKKETAEQNKIYTREDAGPTSSAWWIDNMSGVISSGAAFAIEGATIGALMTTGVGAVAGAVRATSIAQKIGRVMKAVREGTKQINKLSKSDDIAYKLGTWLNSKTNGAVLKNLDKLAQGTKAGISSTVLNQIESLGAGMEVYDEMYKRALETGYDDIYARNVAAHAAAHTMNINRANIALNLTSAHLMNVGAKSLRLWNKIPGMDKINMGYKGEVAKGFVGEMVQEAAEESVNLMASEQGKLLGERLIRNQVEIGGLDAVTKTSIETYNRNRPNGLFASFTQDFDYKRPFGNATAKEIFESAFLGAIGGGFQTGATMIGQHQLASSRSTLNKITGGIPSKWFGERDAERYKENVYNERGELIGRKGEMIFETENMKYTTNVPYKAGDVVTGNIVDNNGKVIISAVDDNGVGIAKQLTKDDIDKLEAAGVHRYKKGDDFKITLADGTETTVTVPKLDKKGDKIYKYEKDGDKERMFSSYELEAKRYGLREEEIKDMKQRVEKNLRILDGVRLSNSVGAASSAIDELRTADVSADPNRREYLIDTIANELAAIEAMRSGQALTPKQVANRAKEIKNDIVTGKMKPADMARKQDEILVFNNDNAILTAVQSGNEEQLINIYEDLLRLSPEKAKELGYPDDYRARAQKLLDKVKKISDLHFEYKVKHGEYKAGRLVLNRLYHDSFDAIIAGLDDQIDNIDIMTAFKQFATENKLKPDTAEYNNWKRIFEEGAAKQWQRDKDKELSDRVIELREQNDLWERQIEEATQEMLEEIQKHEDSKSFLSQLRQREDGSLEIAGSTDTETDVDADSVTPESEYRKVIKAYNKKIQDLREKIRNNNKELTETEVNKADNAYKNWLDTNGIDAITDTNRRESLRKHLSKLTSANKQRIQLMKERERLNKEFDIMADGEYDLEMSKYRKARMNMQTQESYHERVALLKRLQQGGGKVMYTLDHAYTVTVEDKTKLDKDGKPTVRKEVRFKTHTIEGKLKTDATGKTVFVPSDSSARIISKDDESAYTNILKPGMKQEYQRLHDLIEKIKNEPELTEEELAEKKAKGEKIITKAARIKAVERKIADLQFFRIIKDTDETAAYGMSLVAPHFAGISERVVDDNMYIKRKVRKNLEFKEPDTTETPAETPAETPTETTPTEEVKTAADTETTESRKSYKGKGKRFKGTQYQWETIKVKDLKHPLKRGSKIFVVEGAPDTDSDIEQLTTTKSFTLAKAWTPDNGTMSLLSDGDSMSIPVTFDTINNFVGLDNVQGKLHTEYTRLIRMQEEFKNRRKIRANTIVKDHDELKSDRDALYEQYKELQSKLEALQYAEQKMRDPEYGITVTLDMIRAEKDSTKKEELKKKRDEELKNKKEKEGRLSTAIKTIMNSITTMDTENLFDKVKDEFKEELKEVQENLAKIEHAKSTVVHNEKELKRQKAEIEYLEARHKELVNAQKSLIRFGKHATNKNKYLETQIANIKSQLEESNKNKSRLILTQDRLTSEVQSLLDALDKISKESTNDKIRDNQIMSLLENYTADIKLILGNNTSESLINATMTAFAKDYKPGNVADNEAAFRQLMTNLSSGLNRNITQLDDEIAKLYIEYEKLNDVNNRTKPTSVQNYLDELAGQRAELYAKIQELQSHIDNTSNSLKDANELLANTNSDEFKAQQKALEELFQDVKNDATYNALFELATEGINKDMGIVQLINDLTRQQLDFTRMLGIVNALNSDNARATIKAILEDTTDTDTEEGKQRKTERIKQFFRDLAEEQYPTANPNLNSTIIKRLDEVRRAIANNEFGEIEAHITVLQSYMSPEDFTNLETTIDEILKKDIEQEEKTVEMKDAILSSISEILNHDNYTLDELGTMIGESGNVTFAELLERLNNEENANEKKQDLARRLENARAELLKKSGSTKTVNADGSISYTYDLPHKFYIMNFKVLLHEDLARQSIIANGDLTVEELYKGLNTGLTASQIQQGLDDINDRLKVAYANAQEEQMIDTYNLPSTIQDFLRSVEQGTAYGERDADGNFLPYTQVGLSKYYRLRIAKMLTDSESTIVNEREASMRQFTKTVQEEAKDLEKHMLELAAKIRKIDNELDTLTEQYQDLQASANALLQNVIALAPELEALSDSVKNGTIDYKEFHQKLVEYREKVDAAEVPGLFKQFIKDSDAIEAADEMFRELISMRTDIEDKNLQLSELIRQINRIKVLRGFTDVEMNDLDAVYKGYTEFDDKSVQAIESFKKIIAKLNNKESLTPDDIAELEEYKEFFEKSTLKLDKPQFKVMMQDLITELLDDDREMNRVSALFEMVSDFELMGIRKGEYTKVIKESIDKIKELQSVIENALDYRKASPTITHPLAFQQRSRYLAIKINDKFDSLQKSLLDESTVLPMYPWMSRKRHNALKRYKEAEAVMSKLNVLYERRAVIQDYMKNYTPVRYDDTDMKERPISKYIEEVTKTIENLKKQLEEQETKVTPAALKIIQEGRVKIENDLDKAIKERTEIENRIKELESNVTNDLEDSVKAELQLRIDNVKKELDSKSAEVTALSNSLNDYNAKHDNRTEIILSVEKTLMDKISSALTEMTTERLKEDNLNMKAELIRLKSELDSVSNQLKNMTDQDVAKDPNKYLELDARRVALQKSYDDSLNTVTAFENGFEAIFETIQSTEDKIRKGEYNVDELGRIYAFVNLQLDKVNKVKELMDAEVEKINKEIGELSYETSSTGERNVKKGFIVNHNKQFKALKDLEKLEKTLADSIRAKEKAGDEVEQSRIKIETFKQYGNNEGVTAEQLSIDLKNKEIGKLDRKIKDLRKKVEAAQKVYDTAKNMVIAIQYPQVKNESDFINNLFMSIENAKLYGNKIARGINYSDFDTNYSEANPNSADFEKQLESPKYVFGKDTLFASVNRFVKFNGVGNEYDEDGKPIITKDAHDLRFLNFMSDQYDNIDRLYSLEMVAMNTNVSDSRITHMRNLPHYTEDGPTEYTLGEADEQYGSRGIYGVAVNRTNGKWLYVDNNNKIHQFSASELDAALNVTHTEGTGIKYYPLFTKIPAANGDNLRTNALIKVLKEIASPSISSIKDFKNTRILKIKTDTGIVEYNINRATKDGLALSEAILAGMEQPGSTVPLVAQLRAYAAKQMQLYRNTILQEHEKGTRVYSRIDGVNYNKYGQLRRPITIAEENRNGRIVKVMDRNLRPVSEVFGDSIKSIGVEVSQKDSAYENPRKGMTYVRLSNGTSIDTYVDTINNNEVVTTMMLLLDLTRDGMSKKAAFNNNTSLTVRNAKDGTEERVQDMQYVTQSKSDATGLINRLINWTGKPLDKAYSKISIWVEGGNLYYSLGDSKVYNINMNVLRTNLNAIIGAGNTDPDAIIQAINDDPKMKNMQGLVMFLQSKRSKVDSKMLKTDEYIHPVFNPDTGKVEGVKYVKTDTHSAYEVYLLENNKLRTDAYNDQEIAELGLNSHNASYYMRFSNDLFASHATSSKDLVSTEDVVFLNLDDEKIKVKVNEGVAITFEDGTTQKLYVKRNEDNKVVFILDEDTFYTLEELNEEYDLTKVKLLNSVETYALLTSIYKKPPADAPGSAGSAGSSPSGGSGPATAKTSTVDFTNPKSIAKNVSITPTKVGGFLPPIIDSDGKGTLFTIDNPTVSQSDVNELGEGAKGATANAIRSIDNNIKERKRNSLQSRIKYKTGTTTIKDGDTTIDITVDSTGTFIESYTVSMSLDKVSFGSNFEHKDEDGNQISAAGKAHTPITIKYTQSRTSQDDPFKIELDNISLENLDPTSFPEWDTAAIINHLTELISAKARLHEAFPVPYDENYKPKVVIAKSTSAGIGVETTLQSIDMNKVNANVDLKSSDGSYSIGVPEQHTSFLIKMLSLYQSYLAKTNDGKSEVKYMYVPPRDAVKDVNFNYVNRFGAKENLGYDTSYSTLFTEKDVERIVSEQGEEVRKYFKPAYYANPDSPIMMLLGDKSNTKATSAFADSSTDMHTMLLNPNVVHSIFDTLNDGLNVQIPFPVLLGLMFNVSEKDMANPAVQLAFKADLAINELASSEYLDSIDPLWKDVFDQIATLEEAKNEQSEDEDFEDESEEGNDIDLFRLLDIELETDGTNSITGSLQELLSDMESTGGKSMANFRNYAKQYNMNHLELVKALLLDSYNIDNELMLQEQYPEFTLLFEKTRELIRAKIIESVLNELADKNGHIGAEYVKVDFDFTEDEEGTELYSVNTFNLDTKIHDAILNKLNAVKSTNRVIYNDLNNAFRVNNNRELKLTTVDTGRTLKLSTILTDTTKYNFSKEDVKLILFYKIKTMEKTVKSEMESTGKTIEIAKPESLYAVQQQFQSILSKYVSSDHSLNAQLLGLDSMLSSMTDLVRQRNRDLKVQFIENTADPAYEGAFKINENIIEINTSAITHRGASLEYSLNMLGTYLHELMHASTLEKVTINGKLTTELVGVHTPSIVIDDDTEQSSLRKGIQQSSKNLQNIADLLVLHLVKKLQDKSTDMTDSEKSDLIRMLTGVKPEGKSTVDNFLKLYASANTVTDVREIRQKHDHRYKELVSILNISSKIGANANETTGVIKFLNSVTREELHKYASNNEERIKYFNQYGEEITDGEKERFSSFVEFLLSGLRSFIELLTGISIEEKTAAYDVLANLSIMKVSTSKGKYKYDGTYVELDRLRFKSNTREDLIKELSESSNDDSIKTLIEMLETNNPNITINC